MPSADTSSYLEKAKSLQDELIEIRRYLHARPELSFQEFETSNYLAKRLGELGFEVKTGIGKTGVVADLGSGSPRVAIRAEMDALPMLERNASPYCSQNPGVMHSCGHDANMACVLTAAKILRSSPLEGAIRIIMQPAAEESCDENGKAGTRLMIEQGAINGVDAIIALHVDSTIGAGKVGIITLPITAAPTSFALRIAAPSNVPENNAIVLACKVVTAIYDQSEWLSSKADGESISLHTIESSGSQTDMADGQVVLNGMILAFSKERRRAIIEHIEKSCSLVSAGGGKFSLEFESEQSQESAEVNNCLRSAACDLLGPERVLTIKRKTWTEDFSTFTSTIPGALMLLGCEIPSSRRSHHSPTFEIDESGLYVGAAVLAAAAHKLLHLLKKPD